MMTIQKIIMRPAPGSFLPDARHDALQACLTYKADVEFTFNGLSFLVLYEALNRSVIEQSK